MITLSKKRSAGVASQQETMDEDVRWIRAARTDIEQFATLYERYFQGVYQYCLRRVKVQEEAEDLTSQVFIQALTHLQDYRGGTVAAWLFQIAHNMVISYFRRNRLNISLEANDTELLSDAVDPLDSLIQGETQDILRTLVATLPDVQQELLALKISGRLTSREIAEMYGKNPNTVRVTLYRMIDHLRKQYQQIVGELTK